ncbi:MAG TPA: GEVED domain-containing protein [Brumimicrobium sp.]|nr:GEVED domain-containing protein [Brumimicrobium sp.]
MKTTILISANFHSLKRHVYLYFFKAVFLLSFLNSFLIQAQTYCEPDANNSSYYINNFSTTGGIQNITNNSTGFSTGGHGVFTGMTAEQSPSGTVNFSVNLVGGTFGFRIWIDWNQNGVFETSEIVYSSTGYSSSHTGSFTVPANAAPGPTRMRVAGHYFSPTGDVDPCATGFTNGEFEDYTFNVSGLTNSPGCPDVSVNPGDLAVNADNIIIPCGENTAVLSVDYLKTGGTESYRVESISYNPPFPFTSGSGATNISSDDYWSETINLGFEFCFYGNTFNKAFTLHDNFQ